VRDDRRAGRGEHADDVGEVFLALVVVRGELAEHFAQRRRLEDVGAGVDLAEAALGRRRVALLDDGGELAAAVAHDAPEAGGVLDLGGEHRRGGLGGLVGVHQRRERLRAQQRDVAVEHDHGARQVGGGLQRDAHRVPGAAALGLGDRDGLGGDLGQVGADLLAAVPDDDGHAAAGQVGLGGGQDVAHQGAAEQRVQDFRHRRLHPLALAGGQDDHVSHGRAPRRCRCASS